MNTKELEPLINPGSHSIKVGTLVKSKFFGEYLGLSSISKVHPSIKRHFLT